MATTYTALIYAGNKFIKEAYGRIRHRTPLGWGIVYQAGVYPITVDFKADILGKSFEKYECPVEGSQASKFYPIKGYFSPQDQTFHEEKDNQIEIDFEPHKPIANATDTNSQSEIKKIKEQQKTEESLFGYDDVKLLIKQHLEYYSDQSLIDLIKISIPDGILLYGPPGCGKTFFAKWIASYLNFEFVELPRTKFGSSYVDGAMLSLSNIIEELKTKKRQVVFFDEFDSVVPDRKNFNSQAESEKVINTLLQEIPNISENENLIIAATNYLYKLDDAIIRTGRFGLKIPVFPPNAAERVEILRNLVYCTFQENSKLIPYLENLVATDENFWQSLTNDMYLFSNSDLKKLAEYISKELAKSFKANQQHDISVLKKLRKIITVKCQDHLDFKNEIDKYNSDLLQERFSDYYNEPLPSDKKLILTLP
jgi:SpoVK/Ycf46/Vps4 family AAA+-type ATPase